MSFAADRTFLVMMKKKQGGLLEARKTRGMV